MLKRITSLARESDRKIADWAYLVIKREVEVAEEGVEDELKRSSKPRS